MDPADWNDRLAALQSSSDEALCKIDLNCRPGGWSLSTWCFWKCSQFRHMHECVYVQVHAHGICEGIPFSLREMRITALHWWPQYLVTLSDWRLTPDYGNLEWPKWISARTDKGILTKHDEPPNKPLDNGAGYCLIVFYWFPKNDFQHPHFLMMPNFGHSKKKMPAAVTTINLMLLSPTSVSFVCIRVIEVI